MADSASPKRALILAGGGMKVAWQAGVLQVLLDEADQRFDLYDAASAGVFQLAMLCQGMSGTQIANNWRNIRPLDAVSINWGEWIKPFFGESLFTLKSLRKKVFARWGLDIAEINKSALDATFNVYNFSDQQLRVISPRELTEDWLAACVALPMWFPSMIIDGKRYIDSVYVTDANIEAAIRRGADELWVIWTVSQLGDWQPGFVATYFQIIEAAANGRYKQLSERIRVNNENIGQGRQGEFCRPITLREIKGEVPLQYLFNASPNRFKQSVQMGVTAAREWCTANQVPLKAPSPAANSGSSMWFHETMHGFVDAGADYASGYELGRLNNAHFRFRLKITIDDIFGFVQDTGRWGTAMGEIESARFGTCPIEKGDFNLFLYQDTAPGPSPNPTDKLMLYRLPFRDEGGRELTLRGHKVVKAGPGAHVWHDTTTLFVEIVEGHGPNPKMVAQGELHQNVFDFVTQLATFRASGPNLARRWAAVIQFWLYFMGSLWDVYGRRIMKYGPF